MICKSAAARRYFVRFAVTMTLYVITLCVVVVAFVHGHPRGALAYLLALMPAIPCIGLLAVFGLYLAEEKDEFQRMLGVQSMLWGIGGTLSVTTVWGFLQSFTHIPHFQPIWTFVLFWGFFGISIPLLLRKCR
jgi:hypothetical protein